MTDHFIYGLYHPDRPRIILYVGSDVEGGTRHDVHVHGGCRTTAKCAARDGVPLAELRQRVLRRWISGEENPEGEVTRALQARGQARWNHPYAFSNADSRKGGRKGGRNGGRKVQATHKCNGTGFYDPEVQRKVQATNKRNGTGFYNPEVMRKAIETNKRNGTGLYDPEIQRKGREILKRERIGLYDPEVRRKGPHFRWHVALGIMNPKCSLCVGAGA